jgi:hypothetical protein
VIIFNPDAFVFVGYVLKQRNDKFEAGYSEHPKTGRWEHQKTFGCQFSNGPIRIQILMATITI